MDSQNFDYIILGSSPISLTRAIELKKKGENVAIVEKERPLGGSWKIIDIEGFKDMEVGCHIMYRDFKAYKHMREKQNINMVPMTPKPLLIRYDKVYNYKMTNFWDVIDLREQFKGRKGFKKFLVYLKSCFIEVLNFKDFYYPKGGSKEIMTCLENELKNLNIPVICEDIKEAKVEEGRVKLKGKQNLIEAKKLVLTANTELESINARTKFILPQPQARSIYHIYFLVSNVPQQELSYIGVKKNKIFRVADMTYENEYYKAKNQRVYCVQLRAEYYNHPTKSKEQIAKEVEQQLRDWKLVKDNSKIEHYEFFTYNYFHRTSDIADQIESHFKENIEVLFSHNFSKAITKVLDR